MGFAALLILGLARPCTLARRSASPDYKAHQIEGRQVKAQARTERIGSLIQGSCRHRETVDNSFPLLGRGSAW